MSTTGRVLLVEDDGRVALPADLRDKLELQRGELVAIETPDGVLLTSRRTAVERDLARVDAELQEYGLSIDEVVDTLEPLRRSPSYWVPAPFADDDSRNAHLAMMRDRLALWERPDVALTTSVANVLEEGWRRAVQLRS